MKIKWIALTLVFCLLLPLGGCAATPPTVMQYGESKVTLNMYRYWLSTYKGSFLTTYTDMSDTAAFWDSAVTDDMTAEDYLNGVVRENIARTLICTELFRESGLTFSKDDEAVIDAYIEDLIKERADGSRKVLNAELAAFGINIDMLREIYIMEDKTSMLFSALYQNGGERALTASDYTRYLTDNYVRIRHIYVNDAYAYQTNEDGSYVYDSTGYAATRELTEAEKADKADKIAKIEEALASGTPFAEVYATYSEDLYYENGYYLTRMTDFIDEVVAGAFDLAVGESRRIDSDYGTHFILRLEMDEKPWENTANADFFDTFESDAASADFMQYLDGLLPAVETDEESLDGYSIRDAAVNYSI